MPVARSSRETFRYVLRCDRNLEPSKQTVFHLRRLSTRVMLALENLQTVDVSSGMQATVRFGDQKMVALRAGLAGWDNFCMSDGTPAPFKSDAGTRAIHGVTVENPASEESISYLQPDWAKELAEAILDGNTVQPADVGN